MVDKRGSCIGCKKRTRHRVNGLWFCIQCDSEMRSSKSLDNALSKEDEQILRQVNRAGLSPKELQLLIRSPKKSKVSSKTYNHAISGHVRIGIISDSHIGQKMFEEGMMKHAGETFRKLKIENVYHVGDILEGMSGRDGQISKLGKVVIMKMFQPGDGSAYAVSYKLQKMVESLEGGKKPEILVEGHYHKAMYMFLRNVHALEAGTLCGQTEWMRGKKIQVHKGYWVLDFDIAAGKRGGIKNFSPTFVSFYD